MARPTNTQFALAVHVLTVLAARPDAVQSSEQLASSAGASPVHVRRVLGRLRRASFVTSRPGVNGGWQPAGDPDEATTLGDVWRAVQGDDRLLGLHEADPECAVGQRIHSALEQIDCDAARALEQELDQTTLCELARRTAADQPLAGSAAATVASSS
jgi:Rrf2 family protein